MPASGRSHAVRITALALAIAVNVLFLTLWLFSRARTTPDVVVTAMIWITAPLPNRLSPKPPPGRNLRTPSTARRPVPIAVAPAPAPSTAITVPLIDWYAEGQRSARNAFKDEVREKPGPSLDSKPQALVLPDASSQPHKFGDDEHREGGENLFWINETCYYSNKPTESMFGVTPWLKLPTCKARSMSERRSEASAADLEKAARPDYLDRPLP
jgi:hypothetical protein